MNDDGVVVIAQHLDDVDLQGWRERIEEVRSTMTVVRPGDTSAGNDGSFATWSSPRRTITVVSDPVRGLSIVSERQAFRGGFTLVEAPCSANAGIDVGDGSAVRAALDRILETLEDAIPDEGDADVPSQTWGVLSGNLHQLADDLLCKIADTFGKTDPDGLDMLASGRTTLRTGAPWGDPAFTIRIDDEDMPLLAGGGVAMIASMMRSVTGVSVQASRTLVVGPVSIERKPWRDPGPVARMRGIARFSRSR